MSAEGVRQSKASLLYTVVTYLMEKKDACAPLLLYSDIPSLSGGRQDENELNFMIGSVFARISRFRAS